jgi:hypothetical protein
MPKAGMLKAQHLARKDRMFKHSIRPSMFRGELVYGRA